MTRLPADTALTAAGVQMAVYRRLSDEQRFVLAVEMSALTRSLAESEIRRRQPTWDDHRVKREMLRMALFPAPLPRGAE